MDQTTAGWGTCPMWTLTSNPGPTPKRRTGPGDMIAGSRKERRVRDAFLCPAEARQGSGIGVTMGRGGRGSVFGFEIRFDVPYQAPTDRGPGSGIGVTLALSPPHESE